MDKKLKGIVIKNADFGESDKQVTILTFEQGKINFKARSVKKAKAKLKFATEPFSFGDFELATGRGMPILTGCDLIEAFYDIRQDIEKYYLACSVLEFVDRITSDGQDTRREFIFIVKAMRDISEAGEDTKALAVKIFFDGLQSTGYGLPSVNCSGCDEKISKNVYFNVEESSFLCEECRGDNPALSIKMFKVLELIVNSSYEQLPQIKQRKEDYVAVLKFLHRYIEYKLGFSNRSLIEYIKMS